MKVGLFTVILRSLKLERALDYAAGLGVQAVEIGTGAYPGTDHCNPDSLLRSARNRKDFLRAFESRGLSISSLSVHGNPLHPNRKFAAAHDAAYRKTVRLAAQLGVDVVTTFSGCPGGARGDRSPNWVTCAWPPDYLEILDYQWNRVAIPYWKRTVAWTRRQGIRRIALEMHPGFVVYNPETLLKLRAAAGDALGANFDPSHLFWQGIDPCVAVRALRGAIWHVHAKDTAIDRLNTGVNGVLDTKHYADEANRSWIFRTVGYGNPRRFWCDFVSALRIAGYDGALSIEHEDSLMTEREGLEKAVRFLHSLILHEPKGRVVWACGPRMNDADHGRAAPGDDSDSTTRAKGKEFARATADTGAAALEAEGGGPLFDDTHAHLDFPDFASDVAGVLERAAKAGIRRVVCVGTDLDSSRRVVAMSESHPDLYAVVGWHPTHVMEAPEDIREPLSRLASHPKVVAIGETGLDYYRMPSAQPGGTAAEDAAYRERQRTMFLQQLEVAEASGLNVVVHQRGEVLDETLEMMAPFAGRVRGQFHCFSGDTAAMERVLGSGSLVSFTGIVTFKNARQARDTVAAAPMGRFMLETDCPYLAPEPYRGKRCEPAHVREIAAVVARAKACDLETLSRATAEAARDFFPKMP